MIKFKLTSDTIMWLGRKLFRIEALSDFNDVKKGDLGGYVEKEENLSHEGDAWVYGNAKVCGNAKVRGNAEVYGDAWVYGNAWVCGNAKVYGDAWVYGNAWVCGNAEVYGDAWVYGNAKVYGNAWVCGNAKVYGNAWVCGNANICGDADYLCFKGLGSCNRNTTFYKTEGNGVSVACGCFSGTIDEFVAKVQDTHKDSKYAKEYLAAVEVVKIHFDKE